MNDAALYTQEYFQKHYARDPKREQMYRLEYARIKERMPLGGSVLDIGCGTGGFLMNFDPLWQIYGFEPSAYAHQRAAGRGIEMFYNLDAVPDDSMDVVVLRGTLQHMAHPMRTLEDATRILRQGGMIAILATPDTDSLVYRIWLDLPALDADRNWILFGNKMLVSILIRLGYEHIEVLHPYRDTPYANPLQDAWQFFISLFLGYRKFAFPGNMMEIYARKI